MKISRESIIIAVIGMVDMVTTLIMVQRGAWEGNPIFEYYLAMGVPWFILMKSIFILAPIFLLELARRHRPVFTKWASRVAIMAYLGLYVIGVMHLNPALMQREGLINRQSNIANITVMTPQYMNAHIDQWRRYVVDRGYRLHGQYHSDGFGD